VPEGFVGATTDVPHLDHDVAKAKQLLSDAGYPNGLDVTLNVYDTQKVQSDVLLEQLKQAGIRATEEVLDQPTFIGRVIHRFRRNLNPEDSARDAMVLSLQARGVLSGSGLAECLALALANWALDLVVLYLFFLAVGHHQHLGAVIVAYSIANLLAVLPITPGGLGIVEATLVALSIPFGAPRQIAVIAVIGYRLVNFWLPLPFGAAAYAHLTSSRRGRRRAAVRGEGMS